MANSKCVIIVGLAKVSAEKFIRLARKALGLDRQLLRSAPEDDLDPGLFVRHEEHIHCPRQSPVDSTLSQQRTVRNQLVLSSSLAYPNARR